MKSIFEKMEEARVEKKSENSVKYAVFIRISLNRCGYDLKEFFFYPWHGWAILSCSVFFQKTPHSLYFSALTNQALLTIKRGPYSDLSLLVSHFWLVSFLFNQFAWYGRPEIFDWILGFLCYLLLDFYISEPQPEVDPFREIPTLVMISDCYSTHIWLRCVIRLVMLYCGRSDKPIQMCVVIWSWPERSMLVTSESVPCQLTFRKSFWFDRISSWS